ncbi:MAG TPA: type IV pilus assembly protein PilM [Candidatus Saccharimonadales bacterium]|nr:type IV pilus assembly protein PilM [Candidatus Saccharimonadales bacterium]
MRWANQARKQANTLFFEDKPLFGLDIGHGRVRVLQLHPGKKVPRIVGYGETAFDPSAIAEDGAIAKPEVVAKAIQELFRHHLVGDITTKRVALSVPIARAFTRSMTVPPLSSKELAEAVRNEAQQYIPAAVTDLYLDYVRNQSNASDDSSSVFIVGMPRQIVDSHLMLARLLGLEAVAVQTSSGAGAHLFARDAQSDVPSVLVDFGSDSADITVYDHGPVVSGTVACGGDQLTIAIAKKLDVTEKEALLIKTKYGLNLSKKQKEIEAALDPMLGLLVKEIRRTVRYFEEHASGKQTISQIVIAGGGANMPGMAEYLTRTLRLAVRSFDPTFYVDFGKLQPFGMTERMSYVTAVGLAMIEPTEVFA